MYEYERCVEGSYFRVAGGPEGEFLRAVLVDVSVLVFEHLPWDVKGFYGGLPDDWEGFFRAAKDLGRRLKGAGLSGDEVRFARAAILMRKLVELSFGDAVSGEVGGCDWDGVRFVFGGKRRAVKRFTFSGNSDVFSRFRAFASVQSSVVVKLCGKVKPGRRGWGAVEEFLAGDKGFCSAVLALKALGADPVIDVKRLDKYISSL